MKEKLLITGASGFLGYHLVLTALSQGFEVYAGVRKSSVTRHLQENPLLHLLELDLSDEKGTRALLQQNGITYIIHAAALTRAKTEADYNFANATLTRNLASAAMASTAGLKKFAFISSLAALGPSANGQPVMETDPPRPLTWYGKSKLLAEQYLQEIPHLPFIILRPTAVFGPREKDLLLLIKSVSRGLEVYIGNKEQRLTFVYVKDLAEIAVKSLTSKINRQSYNISDGQVYSRYSFADAAKKALRKKTVRLQLPLGLIKIVAAGMDRLYQRSRQTPVLNKEKVKELTAEDWSCSIAGIANDLGYQPAYDLERGMAETVQWYQEQKWL